MQHIYLFVIANSDHKDNRLVDFFKNMKRSFKLERTFLNEV